jgi:hypothetical protein
LISSISPYWRINSSAPIYPPPILITSLPATILARIYLVPNIYFPAYILVTLSDNWCLLRWNAKSSSILSPFTTFIGINFGPSLDLGLNSSPYLSFMKVSWFHKSYFLVISKSNFICIYAMGFLYSQLVEIIENFSSYISFSTAIS